MERKNNQLTFLDNVTRDLGGKRTAAFFGKCSHYESKDMTKRMCICMAILFAGSVSVLAGEMLTILAIGDSITEGGKSFACYRQVLVPELRRKNIAFEFIGPRTDAVSAHAGYGGKNTGYLLSISKKTYSKYPADIVMIHSGHNSFSKDKPVPGIIRDTEAMIDNIRKINPEVQILLAQVIPAGKLPKYSYIPELNKELKSLARRLVKKGVRITLVNQAVGFDWKTDTIQDKVHPNASGAKKMSDKWMAALLPALGHTKILAYEQLRLWNGPAPGVADNLAPEKDEPRGRVSHVSVPTLDIYRPHKPNGVALIICSGGSYSRLASGPLGIGAVDEFLKDGYTVCSLKYRLSPPSTNVVKDACMDGARAVRLIRSRAKEWKIDPERVGMIGFSAGSNMILNLACKNDTGDPKAKDLLERLSGRPNFMVLAALWHNKQKITDWAIHPKLPPALILSTRDDRSAPTKKAEEIAKAFRAVQVPVQLEIYDRGGHMAFNFPSPPAADWPQRFRKWIKQLNFDSQK
jgi:acetyl esterase/lipase